MTLDPRLRRGRPVLGHVHTTPTGLRCFEISELPASALLPLCGLVQQQFGFVPHPPVLGPDQVVMRAVHPDGRVLLPGWDVWSGCYFLANSTEDADLIESIGAWLNAELNEPSVLALLLGGE